MRADWASDAALVAAARSGDRRAFDALAERYRAGVKAVALDFTHRFDIAEDLAQEALCRAWEKLPSLEDDARFGPWLRAITANCCRMWLRRPVPQEAELSEGTEVAGPDDLLAQIRCRELERELREGLRQIPRQNRIALLMRFLGGRRYEQIAEFLGVPVSTVQGRIHRARAQLRRRLARYFEDQEAKG